MKAKDLRAKTESELYLDVLKNRKDLFNIRLQQAGGQLENTAQVRFLKRNIAMLKTLLTEKKLNISYKKAK